MSGLIGTLVGVAGIAIIGALSCNDLKCYMPKTIATFMVVVVTYTLGLVGILAVIAQLRNTGIEWWAAVGGTVGAVGGYIIVSIISIIHRSLARIGQR